MPTPVARVERLYEHDGAGLVAKIGGPRFQVQGGGGEPVPLFRAVPAFFWPREPGRWMAWSLPDWECAGPSSGQAAGARPPGRGLGQDRGKLMSGEDRPRQPRRNSSLMRMLFFFSTCCFRTSGFAFLEIRAPGGGRKVPGLSPPHSPADARPLVSTRRVPPAPFKILFLSPSPMPTLVTVVAAAKGLVPPTSFFPSRRVSMMGRSARRRVGAPNAPTARTRRRHRRRLPLPSPRMVRDELFRPLGPRHRTAPTNPRRMAALSALQTSFAGKNRWSNPPRSLWPDPRPPRRHGSDGLCAPPRGTNVDTPRKKALKQRSCFILPAPPFPPPPVAMASSRMDPILTPEQTRKSLSRPPPVEMNLPVLSPIFEVPVSNLRPYPQRRSRVRPSFEPPPPRIWRVVPN